MVIDTALTTTSLRQVELPEMSQSAGARVVFSGCVRDHDAGKSVTALNYSSHPQAGDFLREAVVAAGEAVGINRDEASRVTQVWVRHRIGELELGDEALLAVIDAHHRQIAFALAARVVDEVKARVPIWKQQFYPDGTSEWSNLP